MASLESSPPGERFGNLDATDVGSGALDLPPA
jgi:hypothetical protein